MLEYRQLAISDSSDLLYGVAPHPLPTQTGMLLGGGTVYPELNFTLPPMLLSAETLPAALNHYRQIITGAVDRAVELQTPGIMIEFETLPEMTENPQWAIEISQILLEKMQQAYSDHGLKSVLRITPNDLREMVRPPVMRSGRYLERMLETFEGCAEAGAELLSIESVGGKEIHDDALTFGDLRQVFFALCILGVRDMEFLWTRIADIAAKHNVHAAGDTACGFGNTAMVLADRKMIPKVFAAVVRAISAVRSLVAYECGAVGPGKDCGYENPILKAITGYPMSMEGKAAACAHLSCVGNLPMGLCDVWSNESVQNVKLLSDMAPTVSMEQLAYDCRLLNEAACDGKHAASTLRDWLVRSDARNDPQAFILTPENVIRLARAIVSQPTHFLAGKAVALETIEILQEGVKEDLVNIEQRELGYLDMMKATVEGIDDNEDKFIAEVMNEVDKDKFTPAEYDL